MFPELLKIGPFTLRTYGLMVALGFFFGLVYLLRKARSKGLPETLVGDLVLYAAVAGIAGARLLYVLLEWSHYSRHLLDIFKIWEGGLVYYGGFVAGAAAVVAFILSRPELRPRLWELGDIVVPALALGHFFGRLGCFFAGCCYGAPTALPWGVRYCHPQSLAPLNVPLHPTQLYEAAGNLLIFVALDRYNTRRHRPGMTVMLYLFLYAAMRFAVEFLRADDRGGFLLGLSPGQLVSLAVIAAGGVILFIWHRKR